MAEWLKTFSSRTKSPEVDPLFLLILGHPETQIQIQQKKNPDTLDGIPPFFHTELCIDWLIVIIFKLQFINRSEDIGWVSLYDHPNYLKMLINQSPTLSQHQMIFIPMMKMRMMMAMNGNHVNGKGVVFSPDRYECHLNVIWMFLEYLHDFY